MNDTQIETERLLLRPMTEEDLPFLIALHSDARVTAHIGRGGPWTEQDVRDWLAKTLAFNRKEGLGQRAVVRKSDGKLIGRSGLVCFEVEDAAEHPRLFWGRGSAPADVKTTPILELGYTFHPDAHGHGFATEASSRMRDYAFEVLGVPRIMSVIRHANGPSIRVAERNGLTRVGTAEAFGHSGLRYELTRAEWERRRSSSPRSAR
jgi:RimJ/RimL family protein N-acetyltransferase